MLNATCEWLQRSALPEVQAFGIAFTRSWADSLELRVAVFIIILQCCFMAWVTSMVREIVRTATTVLCKLLVYDSAVSSAPCIRSAHSTAVASAASSKHKTDGGPPPGSPPARRHGSLDVQ